MWYLTRKWSASFVSRGGSHQFIHWFAPSNVFSWKLLTSLSLFRANSANTISCGKWKILLWKNVLSCFPSDLEHQTDDKADTGTPGGAAGQIWRRAQSSDHLFGGKVASECAFWIIVSLVTASLWFPVRPTRSTPVNWMPCSRGNSSCLRLWATVQTSPPLLLPCQPFWRSTWEAVALEVWLRHPAAWQSCRCLSTAAESTHGLRRSPSYEFFCPTNKEQWYAL